MSKNKRFVAVHKGGTMSGCKIIVDIKKRSSK